jgi:lantibiotic modifying enzyme
MDLFQADRHEVRALAPWNETQARAVIADVAASALARFDPEKLWPPHPLEDVAVGGANLYFGATGVILALDYLKRAGAIEHAGDFRAALPSLVERDSVWLKPSPMGAYGSLLLGDMGTHLVAMRLKPSHETADRVLARASDNNKLPLLELMWGTPGSMLACVFMHQMTQERRFKDLYRSQAKRLLAGLEAAPSPRLWRQDLYGKSVRALGLVHGFAGNMAALIEGWSWLSRDQQRIAENVATEMLVATARQTEGCANWPTNADQPEAPALCQICHGAPGIVTAFADAPFSSPDYERLLLEGGELIWRAGPLKKGSNFCHGTGGNAYALLKLYKRTRDRKWLDRARAMTTSGIAQWRAARAEYGQDRYSLWTGDPGFAVCLWSCITGEPHFPTLDTI